MVDPSYAAEVELHGFLMGTGSLRTGNKPLNNGEKHNWLLGEERLRINLDIASESAETAAVVKIDFLNDNVAGQTTIEARELYGEYLADSFEIRAGRQMITWGIADRLFINDVFPKNWTAFFAGQPLEYLKTGSDAIKLSVFVRGWDVEFVGIPFVQTDIVPSSDRYVVFDPGLAIQEPDRSLSNGELAARLHTQLGTTDVAFYAFRGFWHQPDKGVQGVNIIFPRLNNYGLTLQDALLGGVFSIEGGFYQSADDSEGTNPLVANSQYRYLVSYEREIMSDLTLALQFYGELMDNHAAYLPAAGAAFAGGLGPKPLPEHRKITTVNARALWLKQTLTTSLFGMAVVDGGRMLIPDVNYAVSDEFSVNAGGHVFWSGPGSWMLGMMKHDDNVYVNARWSF
ncbi:MAG: hypothetical protein R8K46_01230 [Mariprofundaceae bacterium]